MRSKEVRSLERDETALTAVIEFLSAFALFLMILTAFLSLAQLQMGSNDPAVDRLDRAAVQGLDRLTSDGGWFVPANETGMDYNNATTDWHEQTAEALDEGRIQAGLVTNGTLDPVKINAIQNLTEGDMIDGLGLDEGFSLHLSIEVVSSTNSSRIGAMLFDGGTNRKTASASSTANRQFIQDGEVWQVVLEVHRGGRLNNDLHITELMTRPANGGPEWIEIYNPNDFAIALRGWSLNHTSSAITSDYLFKSGVVAGKATMVLTGDPSSQAIGNASQVIDLGLDGFLGVGLFNGMSDGSGVLTLRYTQVDEARPYDMFRAEWGGDTSLFMITGQSLAWDGNSTALTSWSVQQVPSPGDV
ncbi:MAG: lamin tail domain-containing protein [Euryarchaeota archaeon]|tara:strand:+ start:2875 stop:3951 length:1077 start_codon:yes stop_codon:yes gene_type:complete